MEPTPIRFLADEMLGRLARWLRILGYDTLYLSPVNDHELVRLARAEGRVLLTRDTGLARRRGVKTLLVASQHLEEQLAQVLGDLTLEPSPAFSRCMVCNALLQPLAREDARQRVPRYVYRTHEEFLLCPGCDRVYWRGSHWEHMRELLARLGDSSSDSNEGQNDVSVPVL